MKQFYVYIMTNHHGTLFTGMTNDLACRVYEHRHKLADGFTSRYNISKLVYYEAAATAESAMTREKQIRGWLRRKEDCARRVGQSILDRCGRRVAGDPSTPPGPSSRPVGTQGGE